MPWITRGPCRPGRRRRSGRTRLVAAGVVAPMHEEMHAHADQEWQPVKPVAGQYVNSMLIRQKQTAEDQCVK